MEAGIRAAYGTSAADLLYFRDREPPDKVAVYAGL